jgi:D-glycero-D-manno-heptose 1,7-bisphosphate phosphatase
VNRALFLDRDGTIVEDREYPRDPEQVRLLPGAAEALGKLAAEGWKLIVIGNQSGVGRGLIAPAEMQAVQTRFEQLMRSAGAPVDASYFCLHAPEDGCQCRKPSPLLVQQAAREHAVDLKASVMIGDREADIQCGRAAGCSTIWLRNSRFSVANDLPDFIAPDWSAIHEKLTARSGVQLPPFGGLSDRAYRCP